jgi:hypothetical protein
LSFPWLTQETFDDGTRGNFDSETDASNILTFPHYRQLAADGLSPWQGAHALRLKLSGTATGFITETGSFDTAAAGTIHVWMPVCIGSDLNLTAGDTVILFALDSAGPVNEAVMGVRNNGGVYELFAGETGATNTLAITRNSRQWYQLELSCLIDSGAPNDGTIDFYVDGAAVGAQITGLNQGAITQARLGAVSGTAAGNSGTILIGGIIADDLRIFPRPRFQLGTDTVWVTRDITAFVGPVKLDSVQLTGTGTDAVLTILDTDHFESTDNPRPPAVYVRNVTANDQSPGMNSPISLAKGCYVQLTGTAPQAWVSISSGAPVLSHSGYVNRGLRTGRP